MHWICPLYKLSTCWVFVEVLLSAVFKWPQQWLNMLSSPKISQRLMLNHGWESLDTLGTGACVGSTCWALLCKCTRLCWAMHGWPPNKGNGKMLSRVELRVWPVSNFESTRLNTAQHLSTGCSNALNFLSSTSWQLAQWTNPLHLHAA